MSRSRTSLTPFDIEPHSHLLAELQRGFDECTERKRKDAEEVWKLAQELVDAYDAVYDRSAERKSEILESISIICDNTEKYRQLRRQQLQTSEILQSLARGLFGAPTPQAAQPGQPAHPAQPETGNHNMSVRQPEVAANSQDAPTTEDSHPRQPPHAVDTGSAVENGQANQLFEDLMPPSGIISLSPADRKSLGIRLLRQLQTISTIPRQAIDAKQYRQFFNERPTFYYMRCLYIARCPVHPDLKLTLEEAKKHYQYKHLVEYQERLHVKTMRFFGIKIIDTPEELQRLTELPTHGALSRSEPTGVVTGAAISPGTEFVPDWETEQFTNGNSNAMPVEGPAPNPEHMCQGGEIEVTPSTMEPNPRETSPLSDVEEWAEDVRFASTSVDCHLLTGSEISMDITSDADTRSWASSSATNSREAITEQPEHDGNGGTSGDPVKTVRHHTGILSH
ncbi:hypothetical protein NLG97_g8571 [Lecanicillium saksenae]|uniref:Uncharacterized protein n=1 Tax=Lecanicillium saksenae TaxID=468837 RepID=A0ACC1QME4_9HYPO|nr:hypothetical protein NLG97_g8571 [Lecanicillium saksenae]